MIVQKNCAKVNLGEYKYFSFIYCYTKKYFDIFQFLNNAYY